MKNVVIGIFPEEAKAYETLSALKIRRGTTTVATAGIIKNENGNITIKDGYDFDDYDGNWATGGLIGGLIGFLGGPLGFLLGGSLGTLIGSGIDVEQVNETINVQRQAVSELKNYQLALVMIAEEPSINELDQFLSSHGCNTIIRENYIDVQTKVYQAKDLEERLVKEAKKEMREEKKEKWRTKAELKQKEFDTKINNVKNKLKNS